MHTVNESRAQGCDIKAMEMPEYLFLGPVHCTRTEILLVQDCCVRKNGYADVISFLPREANGKLIFSASKFPVDVVFVEAQEEPAEIHCSISILEEIGYRFPGLIKTHAQARPSAIVHFVYHAERTFEAELSCSNDERFD